MTTSRVVTLDYFGTSPDPDPPNLAMAYSNNPETDANAGVIFLPLIRLLESTGKFIWDVQGDAADGWRLSSVLWEYLTEW